MAPHKFEFSELSDSQTNLNSKQQKGIVISPAVGLILVLLAAVVAVGVGIIVHFAGGNRQVVCNCQSSGKPSAEAIKEGCLELAALGDTDVCTKCSIAYTTSKPGTTPSPTSQPCPTSQPSPTCQPCPTSQPSPTTPPTTEKPKVTDVRLPTSVYPLHYDVTLQTYMHGDNPDNFKFSGSVRILIHCINATDNVTLHINVLTVQRESVTFEPEVLTTAAGPGVSRLEYDTDRQFIIVRLDKPMEASKNYYLGMNFTSPLKNDLHGLYYSSYTRAGKPVYLATTQFQPTDARKAFPCFDEPAIKANFSITLVRPENLISISNMPIIDSNTTFTEDGIKYVKDVYQTTPKMSTYLLAFIICDFQYKNSTTKFNVTYRAWATPESVDQTDYSLDVGVQIIEYFEEYFQVKYPLPKQDMIAIPDFAAGAMENWGLITYRETAMLYKPGVSNEANKERVAIVVSHELSHQWFGNLVTPSWWDDLWLNEGFATFVEYLGVDVVHPEWRMFDKFVVSDLQDAFSFDGLASSHPLYVPVRHPDEINEIFDTISYSKGATIIRMMRHFLGNTTFKNGLTNYLNNNSYGAAFHDDLWHALTQQAIADGKNIDVKDVMDTWALQMNFPVVTVKLSNGSFSTLEVKQERYLSDPTAKELGKFTSRYNYSWTIPLTFTSSAAPRFDHDDSDVYWMFKNETSKTINVTNTIQLPTTNDPSNWILANIEQYGYYRVNYDTENWRALAKQLTNNHTVIPIANRAQIINDVWNLAKANHIGLDIALQITEYLRAERDYVPWFAARIELGFVESMLTFTSLYGPFQSFMRDTVNGSFNHYGLSSTNLNHIDVFTKSLIGSQACFYGIQPCLDKASELFAEWMKDPAHNPIDPNIKTLVYCNAIRNGGWDEWKFALDRYKDATVASEKANLLSAMSCSQHQWILNHFMSLILVTNSTIRKQDSLSVVSNVARNNIGRYLAWNFFRGNYASLKDSFGVSFFAWTNVIGALTESFNTEFDLKEIEDFMKSQTGNLGSGERAFNQAVEKAISNIKWMKINVPIITAWLKKNNYLSDE